MLTFNKRYFFFALAFFITEVLIALYAHDRIVRPYVGDYLVVFLLYCGVRTFFNLNPLKLSIGVLLFSYLIEVLQYFNLVGLLGLEKNEIATVVIGHSFEWIDLLAYTLGVLTILALERKRNDKTGSVKAAPSVSHRGAEKPLKIF